VSRVHRYIEVMYEALLEWLEEENVSWYDYPDDMVDAAKDYIYERVLEAPFEDTPCDNGRLSTVMFADYIFEGELWGDDHIWGELTDEVVFETADDAWKAVLCHEELVKFKKALKNNIKVKIVEGAVNG
jgi:hypothetical protein